VVSKSGDRLYYVKYNSHLIAVSSYTFESKTGYTLFDYELSYTFTSLGGYVENDYIYFYLSYGMVERVKIILKKELDVNNSEVSWILRELGYI